MACCLTSCLDGNEQRLVIRHVPLLARQFQVGLGLAVQVAFQNVSGDLRGHDLGPRGPHPPFPLGESTRAGGVVRPLQGSSSWLGQDGVIPLAVECVPPQIDPLHLLLRDLDPRWDRHCDRVRM